MISLKEIVKKYNIIEEEKIDEFIKFLEEVAQITDIKETLKNEYNDLSEGYFAFNKFMQKLGLENYKSKSFVENLYLKLFSVLVPRDISNNDKIQEKFSNILPNFINDIHFKKGISLKVDQIRLLGSNHFFMRASLEYLRDEIEKGNLPLSKDCKLLLLCGKHTNNMFGEDNKPENIEALELVDKIFPKETRLFEVVAVDTELKPNHSRPNTIDTIRKADEVLPHKNRDNNILVYLAYQPFLSRQLEDQKLAKLYSESNTQIIGASYKGLQKSLDDAKIRGEKVPDAFSNRQTSFLLSELSRMVYAKTQLLTKENIIQKQESKSICNIL